MDVYPPREDTYLLLPFAQVPPGTTLADVGTGAGLAALTAARHGARVVATDMNPVALRRLLEAARAEHLAIKVVRTDLLRGLGRFDRILANPPYLPTRSKERDPDLGINLALDGGPDGCRVLARLVRGLSRHLAAAGIAYIVVSSLQDPSRRAAILARWVSGGGSYEVAATRWLEGERLDVLRMWRSGAPDRAGRPTRAVRHGRAPLPGTVARPRTHRTTRSGSSPVPGRERTIARGGA